MKTSVFACLALALLRCSLAGAQTNIPIPWNRIHATSGYGLSVPSAARGGGAVRDARLHCLIQKLDGEATREGLWVTSIATNPERFRVMARAMSREGAGCDPLAPSGHVSIEGQTVCFTRPGLVEEYSVSMDGVRQDFVVLEKPGDSPKFLPSNLNSSPLRLELVVTGARVEQATYGAQLVLEHSGRRIAYSRLKVTDARGKQLPAKIEVTGKPENRNPKSGTALAIAVNDSDAVYPVRIDPTFSDAHWISMGGVSGASSFVTATAVDGSGNLYIAGTFTAVGDLAANYIARWNGSTWSALGSGTSLYVYALAASGSNVYAGGAFSMAGGQIVNNIARWDGSTWSALGSGMNSIVQALAVSGSNVYAGGSFTTAGGTAVNQIAKWDGNAWSALGSGVDNTVSALAMSGSDLYAGGSFMTATNSGGVALTVNRVAQWDGTNWSALGMGMNSDVRALSVSGSDLYAGGYFWTATNSGGVALPVNRIAKWNGVNWSALGAGIGGGGPPAPNVAALTVSGNDVYAGGEFTTAGGGAATNIAKWNGTAWSALGAGMNDRVATLAMAGSDVYAGGMFSTADASAASRIAKWNGAGWSPLGSGINNHVYALAMSGSEVYLGGAFISAGGVSANRIAKWNRSAWSPLGSGMNSNVYALAVSGSDLYAGGGFTTAGGSAANRIARWNGSAWSTLGLGMNSNVLALAVSGSDVYAGGIFTTAGGSAANRIAKWNGSVWSALGSGLNSNVYALAVSGSNVFAGGTFTNAGGSPANYIARWNGNSWSALGSGIGGGAPFTPYVAALAVSGNDLYAGGWFSTAGGSPANYIARWNGTNWSAVGLGVNAHVYSLVASGSNVYAGGAFMNAGGSLAIRIAKWDGSAWTPLGSGMDDTVWALAASASDLFAGGAFARAGGKVSAFVARGIVADPPLFFLTTSGSLALTNGQFYTTLVGPAGSNAIIFASTNLQNWMPLLTNPLSGGLINFTDAQSTNLARRFYRALLQP